MGMGFGRLEGFSGKAKVFLYRMTDEIDERRGVVRGSVMGAFKVAIAITLVAVGTHYSGFRDVFSESGLMLIPELVAGFVVLFAVVLVGATVFGFLSRGLFPQSEGVSYEK